ncbi:glutamate racemase [Arenibaculum pallidiluteum]|uniref:glutamate racemase n=1 Tax=Arenibaculum pallidiluteum TaxID=2812559 RepID=UPI001A96D07D|nr:aspartate/glutamate racemase family protein [Arenibaculum pallidiluteum]
MIGVFDSGHGGLTVQRRLAETFPALSFLYLGDHANAPYGPRTGPEVLELTRAGVDLLFDRGCRLVILACNTAAAVALRKLQQEWLPERAPGRRILGVLVPTVEAITGAPWRVETPPVGRVQDTRTVAIFATQRTVLSNSFPVEIAKRAPALRVVQQPCPELAGAIEAGAPEAALRTLVASYVDELLHRLGGRMPDSVVLGCTHYPLVAGLFADRLPGVQVLSQPDLVAESLAGYLERRPEYAGRDGGEGGGVRRFLTTGDPARVSALAQRFFGRPMAFEPVRAAAA